MRAVLHTARWSIYNARLNDESVRCIMYNTPIYDRRSEVNSACENLHLLLLALRFANVTRWQIR